MLLFIICQRYVTGPSKPPAISCAIFPWIFLSLFGAVNANVRMPDLAGHAEHLMSPLDANLEVRKGVMPPISPVIRPFHDEDFSPTIMYDHVKRYGSGQPYWMGQIKRQGQVAYGNSTYQIWRNVMDFGATGDGQTDDTAAINNASNYGGRCEPTNCDSSTTTPAILYFPPGTYIVSAPIQLQYYTQVIGDANNLPTIMGSPGFAGLAMLDADPYTDGREGYTDQNNFYRQIRNFVLDLTQVPPTAPVNCIHWQVAQATSLQNIVFNLAQADGGTTNSQGGIWMENGSGGFFEDLIFNGGGTGFFAGSQQFTVRNLTFNDCTTAISHFWAWVFLYKDITINNCGIGFDLSVTDPSTSDVGVGSIVIQDSVFNNVAQAILTNFTSDSTPSSANTLVLDNVEFINTDPAVLYHNGTPIATGNRVVDFYIQGSVYSTAQVLQNVSNHMCYEPKANYARVQGDAPPIPKPQSLLTPSGTFLERSRPQYEGVPVQSFISVIDFGCIGDGLTDDTRCVQEFLDSIGPDEIAYFDHGAYLISDTIQVPNNVKMQGEIWPMFMITTNGLNSTFSDQTDPQPAFRVGNPGDTGTVEMVELVFETRGPVPGAIIIEWNLAGTTPGATGMWDTHFRIGGTNGTLLQSTNCTKDPTFVHGAPLKCQGAYMLLHITSSASLIMSNNWGWVADHELDLPPWNQTDIYNGRGVLVESQGPVWMYGTAFEHSMLYNYEVASAKDIYMGIIQSETAYMQDNPNALTPFWPNSTYSDPTFSECGYPVAQANCIKTFGLRLFNTTDTLVYGAGLYSFFDQYQQGCLSIEDCQMLMVSLEQSEGIHLFALNTKAAQWMVEVDQVFLVPEFPNQSSFCQCLALFQYP